MTREHGAVTQLVDVLRQEARERPTLITWLNHWSALQIREEWDLLSGIDFVGLDGLFLRRLLRAGVIRTSADLVLPVYIKTGGKLRIAHIGGDLTVAQKARDALVTLSQGRATVVASLTGYGDDLDRERFKAIVLCTQPDLLIVGLGAGLQEQFAALGAEVLGQGLVATCGGWLDQVTQDQYYPPWAYPLRLNWLVRLAKEPRRLWRRYTIDAFLAVMRRRELRARFAALHDKLVPSTLA